MKLKNPLPPGDITAAFQLIPLTYILQCGDEFVNFKQWMVMFNLSAWHNFVRVRYI